MATDGTEDDGKKTGVKPLVTYPTDYSFKVMGLQEHGFREHVRQLFKRALAMEVPLDSISEQPSAKGKYLSVTVTVYLISEEQRVAVYSHLHEDKRVLYYL
jgi:uncharacterized protein